MIQSEGVLEIPNWEDETEKLSEGDHKSDSEAGALGGEDKHGGDADVLRGDVGEEVEEHDGDGQVDHGEADGGRGDGQGQVVADVAVQQQEPGQGQGVGVEQSFFGMFAKLAINYLKLQRNKLQNLQYLWKLHTSWYIPILADRNKAKVNKKIPTGSQTMSSSSSPSEGFGALADMMVQMMMPAVIIRTETYLVLVYLLPSRTMPIIMFAIKLPARNIMCRGMGMLKFNA